MMMLLQSSSMQPYQHPPITTTATTNTTTTHHPVLASAATAAAPALPIPPPIYHLPCHDACSGWMQTKAIQPLIGQLLLPPQQHQHQKRTRCIHSIDDDGDDDDMCGGDGGGGGGGGVAPPPPPPPRVRHRAVFRVRYAQYTKLCIALHRQLVRSQQTNNSNNSSSSSSSSSSATSSNQFQKGPHDLGVCKLIPQLFTRILEELHATDPVDAREEDEAMSTTGTTVETVASSSVDRADSAPSPRLTTAAASAGPSLPLPTRCDHHTQLLRVLSFLLRDHHYSLAFHQAGYDADATIEWLISRLDTTIGVTNSPTNEQQMVLIFEIMTHHTLPWSYFLSFLPNILLKIREMLLILVASAVGQFPHPPLTDTNNITNSSSSSSSSSGRSTTNSAVYLLESRTLLILNFLSAIWLRGYQMFLFHAPTSWRSNSKARNRIEQDVSCAYQQCISLIARIEWDCIKSTPDSSSASLHQVSRRDSIQQVASHLISQWTPRSHFHAFTTPVNGRGFIQMIDARWTNGLDAMRAGRWEGAANVASEPLSPLSSAPSPTAATSTSASSSLAAFLLRDPSFHYFSSSYSLPDESSKEYIKLSLGERELIITYRKHIRQLYERVRQREEKEEEEEEEKENENRIRNAKNETHSTSRSGHTGLSPRRISLFKPTSESRSSLSVSSSAVVTFPFSPLLPLLGSSPSSDLVANLTKQSLLTREMRLQVMSLLSSSPSGGGSKINSSSLTSSSSYRRLSHLLRPELRRVRHEIMIMNRENILHDFARNRNDCLLPTVTGTELSYSLSTPFTRHVPSSTTTSNINATIRPATIASISPSLEAPITHLPELNYLLPSSSTSISAGTGVPIYFDFANQFKQSVGPTAITSSSSSSSLTPSSTRRKEIGYSWSYKHEDGTIIQPDFVNAQSSPSPSLHPPLLAESIGYTQAPPTRIIYTPVQTNIPKPDQTRLEFLPYFSDDQAMDKVIDVGMYTNLRRSDQDKEEEEEGEEEEEEDGEEGDEQEEEDEDEGEGQREVHSAKRRKLHHHTASIATNSTSSPTRDASPSSGSSSDLDMDESSMSLSDEAELNVTRQLLRYFVRTFSTPSVGSPPSPLLLRFISNETKVSHSKLQQWYDEFMVSSTGSASTSTSTSVSPSSLSRHFCRRCYIYNCGKHGKKSPQQQQYQHQHQVNNHKMAAAAAGIQPKASSAYRAMDGVVYDLERNLDHLNKVKDKKRKQNVSQRQQQQQQQQQHQLDDIALAVDSSLISSPCSTSCFLTPTPILPSSTSSPSPAPLLTSQAISPSPPVPASSIITLTSASTSPVPFVATASSFPAFINSFMSSFFRPSLPLTITTRECESDHSSSSPSSITTPSTVSASPITTIDTEMTQACCEDKSETRVSPISVAVPSSTRTTPSSSSPSSSSSSSPWYEPEVQLLRQIYFISTSVLNALPPKQPPRHVLPLDSNATTTTTTTTSSSLYCRITRLLGTDRTCSEVAEYIRSHTDEMMRHGGEKIASKESHAPPPPGSLVSLTPFHPPHGRLSKSDFLTRLKTIASQYRDIAKYPRPCTDCNADVCTASADSTSSEKCTCACAASGSFCDKWCGCSDRCANRYRGCRCTNNTCRTATCACFQAQRECDPDLCHSCGVEYELDPQLHVTILHHEERQLAAGETPKIRCRNISLRSNTSHNILLGRSAVHGYGAFVGYEPIPKDRLITEYVGELISHAEADRRGKIYDQYNCSYLFNLDDESVVDAARKGNRSRFANHAPAGSAKENCYPKIFQSNGVHRIGLIAKRKLKIGEELFFDYAHDHDASWNANQRTSAPVWFKQIVEASTSTSAGGGGVSSQSSFAPGDSSSSSRKSVHEADRDNNRKEPHAQIRHQQVASKHALAR